MLCKSVTLPSHRPQAGGFHRTMPERLADTCARLLTIKKSALAMRKPEAAPESGSMSPAKADAAAPPATDKSPAAKPDAKVARTEGEEKEEKAEAPPPFVFTPSTPVNTDGDAKVPIRRAAPFRASTLSALWPCIPPTVAASHSHTVTLPPITRRL